MYPNQVSAGMGKEKDTKKNMEVEKNAEKYCQKMMMRELKRLDDIRKEEIHLRMKKLYPHIPHPDMPQNDSVSEKYIHLMNELESKSKTEVVTEKFGGLPLGYSGYPPVTPPEYNYYGLTECQQMKSYVPDYPSDLHMHQTCVPRDAGLRQTFENLAGYPLPSFTPPIEFPSSRSSMGSIAPSIKSTHSMLVFFGKAPLTAPKEQPPIVGTADAEAYNYLDYYSIDVMFEYFVTLLLKRKPAEPFVFIRKLIKSMLQARHDPTIFARLPRVFRKSHVKHLFKMYDKFRQGTMTTYQYKTAMESLGLYRFKSDPEGFRENKIPENVFVNEAIEALNFTLRSFLVLSPGKKADDQIDYALDATDQDILTDNDSILDLPSSRASHLSQASRKSGYEMKSGFRK